MANAEGVPGARRGTIDALLCVGVVLSLFGCTASPPEATRIEANISASADVNPDFHGKASPIFFKLYELTSDTTFTTATFNQLYNDDKATLGEALRGSQEVSLAPGQRITISREFEDGSAYVGVLAAFQNIDAAQWRATAPVPANATTLYEVTIGPADVAIRPVSPP